MKPYSLDLRERIVAARREGQSVQEVATRFGVCTRTVSVYWKLAQEQNLAPKPIPGKAPRLKAEHEPEFLAMVEAHPNWTLEQFKQEWQARTGVVLPKSTLHDHLKRLGGRYKKRVVSPKSDVN